MRNDKHEERKSMRNIGHGVKCLMVAVVVGLMSGIASQAAAKPLKVFILAGQSNMQGHVNVSTFDSLASDPKTAPILKEMRNADGTPHVCEKVWISSIGCAGDDTTEQKGKVTVGFGASRAEIGPEFMFGIYMEGLLGEPILIMGGRSLHTDFRPPSAGPETFNDFIVGQWKNMHLDVDQESAKINKRVGAPPPRAKELPWSDDEIYSLGDEIPHRRFPQTAILGTLIRESTIWNGREPDLSF